MTIYTDGSAAPNPGQGGYGVVLLDDNDNIIECYQHREEYTTNNIQELKSILYALIKYGVNINNPLLGFVQPPIVYSDSAYAVNTFNSWMFSWERNGWLKSDHKVPENLELIQAYFDLYQKGWRIDLKKVKGHNNIKGNELADKLATNKLTVEQIYKMENIKWQK